MRTCKIAFVLFLSACSSTVMWGLHFQKEYNYPLGLDPFDVAEGDSTLRYYTAAGRWEDFSGNLHIYDVTGRLIAQLQIQQGKIFLPQYLSPGLYFLKTGDGWVTRVTVQSFQ